MDFTPSGDAEDVVRTVRDYRIDVGSTECREGKGVQLDVYKAHDETWCCSTLTPDEARQVAAFLLKHADRAEGKNG